MKTMKQKIQFIFSLFILLSVGLLYSSCDHEDWYADRDLLLTDDGHGSLKNGNIVATGDVRDVTTNSATILCSANYNYKEALGIKPGIILSTSTFSKADVMRYDSKLSPIYVTAFASSECEVQLNKLEHATKYYYCAYAEDKDGKKHIGEIKSFTTLFDYSIYKPVDLGLSVKWANMNIEAEYPSSLGSTWFWGETKSNKSLSWHELELPTLIKQGYIDNNYNLCPAYDTATDILGDNWRMPTKDEFQELIDKCTWKEVNSGTTFLITGPNDNYIYLPVSSSSSSYDCYYWSSTCNSDYAYSLRCVRKYSWEPRYEYVIGATRSKNMYIRPVMK